MLTAPCKDCPDRNVTAEFNCHSYCESYARYQSVIRLRRKIRFKQAQQTQAEYEAKHKVRMIAQKLEQKDRDRGIKR